jgi:hypothetical protein
MKNREHLVQWAALDPELKVLARGLMTVQEDAAGRFIPVSELKNVLIENAGLLWALLLIFEEQAHSYFGVGGILARMPAGTQVMPGNRMTLTWTKDQGLFYFERSRW